MSVVTFELNIDFVNVLPNFEKILKKFSMCFGKPYHLYGMCCHDIMLDSFSVHLSLI